MQVGHDDSPCDGLEDECVGQVEDITRSSYRPYLSVPRYTGIQASKASCQSRPHKYRMSKNNDCK